jgi:hypothetical protein
VVTAVTLTVESTEGLVIGVDPITTPLGATVKLVNPTSITLVGIFGYGH